MLAVNNQLQRLNKTAQRRAVMAFPLLCVGVAAGLLMSCQPATEESGAVSLSILEWSGFEKPEFYPEFTASYGGSPAFTIFSDTNDAMQRMRKGLKTDLAHLCTGQMQEARHARLFQLWFEAQAGLD